MPWVFGAFLVASISIIGIPPMGGSWPKYFLIVGALESGKGILTAALVLSSILNIVYLIPISIRAFLKTPKDTLIDNSLIEVRKKNIWVIIPPVISAAGAFILFFYVGSIVDFLQPVISVGE
jgi:multicomponent Na+:H+ antiporter subunit D